MRRQSTLLTIVILAGLMLAACTATTADDDAGDDATDPAPVETPTATAEPGPADDQVAVDDEAADDAVVGEDDEGAPEDDESPLAPDDFWLVGASGEQFGWPISYFWTEEDLGIEITGHYVPLHDEPLAVEQGETLTMRADHESDLPEEIVVRVFSRDDVTVEEQATRWGTQDAYFVDAEPVLEEEVTPDSMEWTVDLDSGEYFVVIETTWPTPEEYPLQIYADFWYWIEVG
jgi:hypothetical protein